MNKRQAKKNYRKKCHIQYEYPLGRNCSIISSRRPPNRKYQYKKLYSLFINNNHRVYDYSLIESVIQQSDIAKN